MHIDIIAWNTRSETDDITQLMYYGKNRKSSQSVLNFKIKHRTLVNKLYNAVITLC